MKANNKKDTSKRPEGLYESELPIQSLAKPRVGRKEKRGRKLLRSSLRTSDQYEKSISGKGWQERNAGEAMACGAEAFFFLDFLVTFLSRKK